MKRIKEYEDYHLNENKNENENIKIDITFKSTTLDKFKEIWKDSQSIINSISEKDFKNDICVIQNGFIKIHLKKK